MNLGLHTRQPIFDTAYYLADNRVIPEQVAFRDALNPNTWIHPDDLKPAREGQLWQRLESAFSVEYPTYHANPMRNNIVTNLYDLIAVDPGLSTEIPNIPGRQEHPSNPYQYPLTHLVNGEPFPPLLSPAESAKLKEATASYLILEFALADRGYPELLANTMNALARRGVTKPSAEHIFHELRDALGVNSIDLIRALDSGGADGLAQTVGMSGERLNSIYRLSDYISTRGFPLNDVINWEYGQRNPAMWGAPVGQIIEQGKQMRIDDTIQSYRNAVEAHPIFPDQRKNEALVVAALDNVPPLLSELFFEEGGQIIFTQENDLRNVLGGGYLGLHLSYESPRNSMHAIRQVYLSQDLGLPKNTGTLVHELHHLFYPRGYISPQEAMHGDTLLESDEQRILKLKELVETFQTGTPQQQASAIATLDSPAMAAHGLRFSNILESVSMETFIGAVNEAYHFLQMESPSYGSIPTYHDPFSRFNEIIPRYAEKRYVVHRDHPEILDFIAPGITEMYQDIYLPHLQRRLDHIRQTRPSRMDGVSPQTIPSTVTLPPTSDNVILMDGIEITPPRTASAQLTEQEPTRTDNQLSCPEGEEPCIAAVQARASGIPTTHIEGLRLQADRMAPADQQQPSIPT